MYHKVYINNKPLFLCDEIAGPIVPYRQQQTTAFTQGYTPGKLTTFLLHMADPPTQAGIFYDRQLDNLKQHLWDRFTVQQAAGGLVVNSYDEILLIFRRNKWDLPKGKLEPGEALTSCAMREVAEETGLHETTLKSFLLTTYHTYHENSKQILKENYWYLMQVHGRPALTPQTAEDITEAKWLPHQELTAVISNTYPSIIDVLTFFNLNLRIN